MNLDLTPDQLADYAGRNPKPADFDAYWDAALAELDALDPDARLTKADFRVPGVECFDLAFRGVGGAAVYAKYVRPARRDGPCGAAIGFHGYTMSSGDWAGLLRWPAVGMCAAALDVRGQGGRSSDPGGHAGNTQSGHIIRGLEDALAGRPERLFYRDVFLDCASLARIVAGFEEVDGMRIGAHGGSQGGGLTLACAALAPGVVSRAAPYYPFLCDYKRVWEMDLAKAAYGEIKTWFKHHDPRHERRDAVFQALGYVDVQHLCPRVTAEVRMACGLMDDVCPPSTQFAAFNKVASDKGVAFYPDFGHEHLPGWDDETVAFLRGA